MSEIIFFDSFDTYSTTQDGASKWTEFSSFIGFGPGRTGQCISFFATTEPFVTFQHEIATAVVGHAYKTQSFANDLHHVTNSRTGQPPAGVTHLGDGRLKVYFGSDSALLDGFVMSLNKWFYIEASYAASIVSGNLRVTYEVRINGSTTVWHWTGVLNSGTGSSFAFASLTLGGPGGGNSCSADDVYVTDGEFLGDVHIYRIFPNAAGDSTQWAPTGAGVNYQCVNEHTPDYFATYNSTHNVSDKDLYNMDNVSFVGVCKGIQAVWDLTKSDAGTASVKGVVKTNSSEYLSTEMPPSDGDWLYLRQPYRKNPNTGLDFTLAEINAIQLGIERQS